MQFFDVSFFLLLKQTKIWSVGLSPLWQCVHPELYIIIPEQGLPPLPPNPWGKNRKSAIFTLWNIFLKQYPKRSQYKVFGFNYLCLFCFSNLLFHCISLSECISKYFSVKFCLCQTFHLCHLHQTLPIINSVHFGLSLCVSHS